MVTARAFAAAKDTPYRTVMFWLSRGLIKGARKQENDFGGFYYLVPLDAQLPELKRGPKPKKETTH